MPLRGIATNANTVMDQMRQMFGMLVLSRVRLNRMVALIDLSHPILNWMRHSIQIVFFKSLILGLP